MENTEALLKALYDFENRIINAVSLGETNNAVKAFEEARLFLQEMPYPEFLSDLKGYCYGLNAMLRKTAERCGAKLDYLTELYTDKAEQISLSSVFGELIKEIIVSYCDAVKNNSKSQYSTPVRKAVIKIHNSLEENITLGELAKFSNISEGYFSTIFKKETGLSLTDYINKTRIEKAAKLIRTTNLQMNEIARLCGINDVNYFSKLFKKYEGMPPTKFRSK